MLKCSVQGYLHYIPIIVDGVIREGGGEVLYCIPYTCVGRTTFGRLLAQRLGDIIIIEQQLSGAFDYM